jgi:hypothetical protein
MKIFQDYKGRIIRLSDERLDHLETEHPEMVSQLERVSETLVYPERVVRSKTDNSVELFYKHYPTTPVSEKFLCIVMKTFRDENFIVTVYYTDRIKGGDLLWEKK